MESKKRYPNISMVIGMLLSLMYTLLIAYIFIGNHNVIFAFLSMVYLAVYWYAMHYAKKKFMTESFTVAKVRLINIGGFFLFFFATFFTCLNNVRIAG